jgi:TonB family protein
VSFVVNVEPIETTTEFWPNWQGEIINGVYPLRRLLNGSNHSAIFLTECKAQDVATAAIKIVPAERVTLAQLSHWRTAADLSHPHLIRLLDAGLCQLGGRQFLFVVMEYAEQTLSEVLLQRALTAGEVQELLPPTLEALAFLHGKNLVQGQLKPANFLVVNDQLKLASDTVRPANEPRASVAEPSVYDPPEAEGGTLSPAGDIWALGMTMVEALTQRVPASRDEHAATAGLPTTLAPAVVDTLKRCLSHDPGSRPTAIDLQAQPKRASQAPEVSVPQAALRDAPGPVASPLDSPKQRLLAPITAAVLVVLAVWAGVRLFHSHPNPQQPAAGTAQPASQQVASAPPAALPPKVSAPLASAQNGSVVHEEIPIVPRSARETIQGHVKVAVRVSVDRSGNVIDTLLQNPGPSRYFARLAREAAEKWKFAPAENEESREWLIRFEFGRGGTTGHATASGGKHRE